MTAYGRYLVQRLKIMVQKNYTFYKNINTKKVNYLRLFSKASFFYFYVSFGTERRHFSIEPMYIFYYYKILLGAHSKVKKIKNIIIFLNQIRKLFRTYMFSTEICTFMM